MYPLVNQLEMHPYYNRREIVDFCKEHDIQVMAFSPLAHGDYLHELLNNPMLKEIAGGYGKTVTQVILRWFVDKRICVVPNSKSALHLKENIDIFDFKLNKSEIESIDSLNKNLSFGPHTTRK